VQQDELSLVRQAQELNPEAFTKLYETYFDKIYRYISLRIGNQMEAEDMTQQVFLNALESINSFKWRGVPFSAWLFRIAHNQVVDHLRKKSKFQFVPLDTPSADRDDDCSSAEKVELKINLEQLHSAMGGLTEAQREVISLRFTSELSIAEVAKIMGKNEGAVKALQHSAIRALRRIMVPG